MRAYLEQIVRFRMAVIAVTALVTLVAGLAIKNLRIIVDVDSTMPQDHPYAVGSRKIADAFDIGRVIVVAISAREGDIFVPALLEKVRGISDAVEKDETIDASYVFSLSARRAKGIEGRDDELIVKPLMETVPRTAEQLAELRRVLGANPVFLGTLVSSDFRTASVLIDLKRRYGFGALLQRLEQIVAPYRDASVKIAITGAPIFNAQTENYSQRLVLLFPIVVLLIGFIHYEAFRTFQGLVLPLVTAILAVILSLGFIGASGVPLDAFNVTTPVLILAVAAGHAVQILKRYYEEYNRIMEEQALEPRQASVEAVLASLGKIGPAMIAAGGVACIGFLSLLSIDVSTVRTFGVFTALGILAVLGLELTFIPALRSLLPPPGHREVAREREERFWDRITATISRGILGTSRRAVYAGLLAFVALGAWGATKVQMENSPKRFFFSSLPFVVDDDQVNERLAGTNTLFIMVDTLVEGGLYEPAVMNAIAAIQRKLEADPAVGKTVSIVDYVAKMNKEMHGGDAAYDRVPERRNLIAQYLLLYSDPDDFNKYVDPSYRSANIWSFLKTDNTTYGQHLIDRIKPEAERALGPGVQMFFGGSVPRASALNEVLVRAKILNIVQIGGVIFLVSCLLFRSFAAGMLVLIPLALTVLGTFAVMGFGGIALNTGTAVISALAVGIGADYAIYFLYRVREEIGRGAGLEQAVDRSLRTAGKAVLFVASAVAGGYSVLLFSYGFYLHMWFAVLVGASMIFASFATLIAVPAALMLLRPGFLFAHAPASARRASEVATAGPHA
jgi:predicted RND superfamily exporter protein